MEDLVRTAREIIDKGSKSFALAARLFDRKTYERAIMLYAWCRHCDDQIDGQILGQGQDSPDPKEQSRRLAELRSQTADAMAGKPPEQDVFRAFQRVFQEAAIPPRYPEELLVGFEMDLNRHQYENFEDTLQYCYHVAGTVGAMMACVMGVRDEAILQRAIDLGLAYQLTNICRDIMQDAEDGRIYLPKDWLQEASVPLNAAAFPGHASELFPVCLRMLKEADHYYQSAVYGIAHLPARCAWTITTARAIYRDIGRVLKASHDSPWRERAHTSSQRKLWLAAVSLPQALYIITALRHQKAPERDLWIPRPYKSKKG